MRQYYLRDDDLRPIQPTSADIILRQQLEYSISKYFYDACSRCVQDLLSSCRWYVKSYGTALTLVIECPNQEINWRVLQKVVTMATSLREFNNTAKIRICPPDCQGACLEIRVDEISVYRHWG